MIQPHAGVLTTAAWFGLWDSRDLSRARARVSAGEDVDAHTLRVRGMRRATSPPPHRSRRGQTLTQVERPVELEQGVQLLGQESLPGRGTATPLLRAPPEAGQTVGGRPVASAMVVCDRPGEQRGRGVET